MRGLLSTAAALAACAMALLAWAPGARADAPPLIGAATHALSFDTPAESTHELDLLQKAGANSVRVDMGWSTLQEQGKGQYSKDYVAKADAFFADAHKHGLKVIVTFLGSPCWASSAPPDKKQGCAGQWWTRGVDLYPPTDPADYGEAAAFVAKRWGADIAALEVWNEPDFDYFFNTPDPVGDYARLLKATYPKVKAAAPNVAVLGGSLLGNNVPFLDGLYAAGIGPYTDGISTHPYTIQNDPAATAESSYGYLYHFIQGVPLVRASMVAHGDGAKKLWLTELGWSSCAPGGISAWCVDTATQARYVGSALRVVRDCWDYVQGVAVYTLRNTGPDLQRREDQMGLMYPDFTPKPSFAALGNAISDLRANPGVPAPGAGSAACRVADRPAPAVLPPPAPRGPVTPSSRPHPVAPVVRGLGLRPATMRRGGRTRVSWRLDAAARLTFSVERLGARHRWKRMRGSFARSGRAGRGSLVFAGRLGTRRLGAGRYRLVAQARDRAGHRSRPARATFRILAH